MYHVESAGNNGHKLLVTQIGIGRLERYGGAVGQGDCATVPVQVELAVLD